jgi:hypothetical protein
MTTTTLKYVTPFVAAIMILASCGKKMGNQPLSNDPTVPPAITNVTVDNRPGNAKIAYTVPNNKNILYVLATYVPTNGKPSEVKSSYYEDSLIVDGYADELEHEVKLYTVSRSGVKSEPVVVKIKPLEAPIFKVFRSLQVVNAFGGFNISASNPTQGNIGIIVLSENKFKEYEANNYWSVFSGVTDILSKTRGLDTTTRRLGFYVQDRWGNKTDTLYKNITPIYEAGLDKAKFKPYVLPGDAQQVSNGARLEYAWDDRLGWPYTSFTDQGKAPLQAPHMITFDLGVTAKISRVWIRPFPEGTRFYFLTTIKRFEIYGSTNPSAGGALDNTWTLLDSFKVVKPTNTAYGQDNTVDQETAKKGFDWEIPLTAPKVRYMRIRCLENFNGGTAQSINELTVYGDPR